MNENKLSKEYENLINSYFSIIKNKMKKFNIEPKNKTSKYNEYMSSIIFNFFLTLSDEEEIVPYSYFLINEGSIKNVIKKEKINNLRELVNFYKNQIDNKQADINIENILFNPFKKSFENFIENFIKVRHILNTKVKETLRDDIVSILYENFSYIRETLEKNISETEREWKNLTRKVETYYGNNRWTALFYYLLKKCEDLNDKEISVLMLLLNFMIEDGSSFLCQKEAGKLLKKTRQSISKTLKSLEKKGYIKEDKEFPYSYKNKLCKIYKINLKKIP
ncbi:helix-turn-helix domain-containing protein [Hydrogenothermus marinus]|uniref:Uncharacterized protein n=1 Tax=Hydrogenothermus marinus TaxID=133270 RepID=A0A3M0BUU7_9AQUI|nr:helix-turn-helix domain-containing protein [Hydrogenothermus marinus]RMB00070.1 hypothetical protein CLV39_0039 [Hydrogenothermus marinus]